MFASASAYVNCVVCIQIEELRPVGLQIFTKIVEIFGATENPDAEGILLVEDFVAQVTANE